MDMTNSKSNILEKFNGIILVNKPSGITSYDVIRNLKRFFF
jgi:tRNA U55 pseudouridine synthase TruB